MKNMTKDREGELFMYKVYTPQHHWRNTNMTWLGVNIFLTLLGGGSHMLHKNGKEVINFFPIIQNNLPATLEINIDRSLKRLYTLTLPPHLVSVFIFFILSGATSKKTFLHRP